MNVTVAPGTTNTGTLFFKDGLNSENMWWCRRRWRWRQRRKRKQWRSRRFVVKCYQRVKCFMEDRNKSRPLIWGTYSYSSREPEKERRQWRQSEKGKNMWLNQFGASIRSVPEYQRHTGKSVSWSGIWRRENWHHIYVGTERAKEKEHSLLRQPIS